MAYSANAKPWIWDDHPTKCRKLKASPEQSDNVERWELRNGPDIAVVEVRNLHTAKFHNDIVVTVVKHGFNSLNNPPKNPMRTVYFTRNIIDEFNRMFFKSLEELFDDLASKVPADAESLPFDYRTDRVTFYKGTSAEEILRWFDKHYRSFTGFCCADFYDFEQKYRQAEGFLANAIRARYDF